MTASTYPFRYRTKYRSVSIDEWRGTIWLFGLALALVAAMTIINYTSDGRPPVYSSDASLPAVDLEVLPPRTSTTVEVPPPPPPEEALLLPSEEPVHRPEPIADRIEVETSQTTKEMAHDPPHKSTPVPATPPPPPPPVPVETDDLPRRRAEYMPVFPGCDDSDEAQRRNCTEQRLLRYISENLDYPSIARQNNIEGTVVVSFVINKDGKIQDIEVLRDIGAGCGQSAEEAIEKMSADIGPWQAATQRGRPVAVYYTLPVRFALQ